MSALLQKLIHYTGTQTCRQVCHCKHFGSLKYSQVHHHVMWKREPLSSRLTIAVIALPVSRAYRCLHWFDIKPQFKNAVLLAVLPLLG